MVIGSFKALHFYHMCQCKVEFWNDLPLHFGMFFSTDTSGITLQLPFALWSFIFHWCIRYNPSIVFLYTPTVISIVDALHFFNFNFDVE